MKKNIILLTLLMAIAVAFSSCGDGQKKKTQEIEGETVTIEHHLGSTVVPKNPKRVVALDFSAIENLDYIGVKPVAVPKTNMPSYLAKIQNDTSIENVGTVMEVDLEKINAVKPDLIIIGHRLADMYDQLSAIAPVISASVIDYGDFLSAFKKNLDDLGNIFDKKEEYDRAYEKIEDKISKVKTKVEADGGKGLILLHNRGRFSAYGSGSRFGVIHDVLGVEEAEKNLDTHRHGSPVSSEYVQKVNPDIIFIVDRSLVVNKEVLDKESVENLLIKQTNASKHGRIVYLNPEMWYLAGGGITSMNAMIDEVDQVF